MTPFADLALDIDDGKRIGHGALAPLGRTTSVAALVSGKAGVRDLAGRSFRWRVPLRWYAISLLAPLLIFLIAVTILYGLAPLRALSPRIGCCCSPHFCRHRRS